MNNFSKFGNKFTANSGILELMDDLGKALAGTSGKVNMLGGGNPAHIPEIQKIYRQRMQEILNNEDEYERLISNYDTQQGNQKFIEAFVKFINRKYDWEIGPENIAISAGSQTGYFMLFNILAGECDDGTKKKILLPLVPEYIGIADQGLCDNFYVGMKPKIDEIEKHVFKYGIDFKAVGDLFNPPQSPLAVPACAVRQVRGEEKVALDKGESRGIGGIYTSRPTNPTGNVVTDEEIAKLHEIAKENDIPLMVDNAYGAPYPNVIFTENKLIWDENIILSMSLSKFGLPSSRTGIFIAKKEIAEAISKVNAILSLANPSYGQVLATPLFEDSSVIDISNKFIRPYYKEKAEYATKKIFELFSDDLPWYMHKHEGAFFFWLWFKDLPITTYELYNRLKKRNTIVVPGKYFFPGYNEKWKHKDECIRLNFARPKEEIDEGLEIIAEEVSKAYN